MNDGFEIWNANDVPRELLHDAVRHAVINGERLQDIMKLWVQADAGWFEIKRNDRSTRRFEFSFERA